MISDKLKEIHRLAMEVKEEAALNASLAKSGPVRRYYDQVLEEAHLNVIVNPGAGFLRNVVVRAEAFDRRLAEEIQ